MAKALDYNPDKERHVDHRFVVTSAVPNLREVSLGEETYRFDRQYRFAMRDEKKARELQKEYAGQIAVTRFRHPKPADRGHKYFFGQMPALPWAKYDELGRRIRED